jgi:hypothetical protein
VATHILIRLSYPKQPGDTPWSIIDVDGPASYVQITPGSPGPPVVQPSGGQPVFPQDFGLQSFHIVLAQQSNDGRYAVSAIPVRLEGDDAFNEALLDWIDLATGQQVAAGTNLSRSSVRLLAIGN